MSRRRRCDWYGLAIWVSVVGCTPPAVETGPSYAELVVTYNAELAALDRLEAKREELIKEFAAATAPTATGDAISKLEGLLKSAQNLRDRSDVDATADPEALLDSLTQQSGEAQGIADQLLGGLLGDESDATEPETDSVVDAAATEQKAEFETKLANLDKEIAKQKERVERARSARDAAEAESE